MAAWLLVLKVEMEVKPSVIVFPDRSEQPLLTVPECHGPRRSSHGRQDGK